MTDHGRWLELAALRPAFSTRSSESAELDEHLATCEACSREAAALRADLALVARLEVSPPTTRLRERVREATAARERSGSSRTLVTIAAVGLVAAALVGATLGVGAFLAQQDSPLSQLDANDALKDKRIRWSTEVVGLAADSVRIDANGTALNTETPLLKVDGDPGSLAYWTLEVTWIEAGLEQRLNLYFKADAQSWWIDEVRVYDNVGPQPDWASFPQGPHFRTLLGQPFEGDIDLAGKGRNGPVRLQIAGAVLAVAPRPSFVQPPGGGFAVTTDPFEPGQPLHCSGILQLSPQQAELALQSLGYRLSWRLQWSTGGNSGYSDLRLRAPEGFINGSAVGSDGELIIFVADPARPFGGGPAKFPSDCPPPTTG